MSNCKRTWVEGPRRLNAYQDLYMGKRSGDPPDMIILAPDQKQLETYLDCDCHFDQGIPGKEYPVMFRKCSLHQGKRESHAQMVPYA